MIYHLSYLDITRDLEPPPPLAYPGFKHPSRDRVNSKGEVIGWPLPILYKNSITRIGLVVLVAILFRKKLKIHPIRMSITLKVKLKAKFQLSSL